MSVAVTALVTLYVLKQQLADFKDTHKRDIKDIKDGLDSLKSGVKDSIGALKLDVKDSINTLKTDVKTSIDSLNEIANVKDKNLTENFKRLEAKQDKHNTIIERTYDLEARMGVVEAKVKIYGCSEIPNSHIQERI